MNVHVGLTPTLRREVISALVLATSGGVQRLEGEASWHTLGPQNETSKPMRVEKDAGSNFRQVAACQVPTGVEQSVSFQKLFA